jgi:hypothetical protein
MIAGAPGGQRLTSGPPVFLYLVGLVPAMHSTLIVHLLLRKSVALDLLPLLC